MKAIHYNVLSSNDILHCKDEVVFLMKMVLADNIPQSYPDDLAEQYVDKMPRYIEDGSAIIVGAFYENKLIGFSWAYELLIFQERRIHIDMIGVDPEFRSKGIATRMVDIQIEEAKKRDISIIEAMTTRNNENSYNWFHSMGFVDERVKVKLELNG